jgi:16S rRNA (uracil1498-N3)-methyltransferase
VPPAVPRFFIDGVAASGDRVALGDGDARKAVVVLRRRSGDPVEVCDSTGTVFAAVLEVDGTRARAVLGEVLVRAAETACEIVLCQAVPKGAKMDFVVEKATELGVSRIVPLVTERTVADASPAKRERWSRLARTAAAQCGRTRVPVVDPPAGWVDAIAGLSGEGTVVLLPWELAAREPLRRRLPSLVAGAKRIALLIGPEGGISHDEAAAAVAAGAHEVSLGSRIFRTETAGLVVVSAVLYELGEL